MDKVKDKTKKGHGFLEKWYIINAAKNWFGVNITFNDIDEIKAYYHYKPLGITNSEGEEDRFEEALRLWIEDQKQNKDE